MARKTGSSGVEYVQYNTFFRPFPPVFIWKAGNFGQRDVINISTFFIHKMWMN